MFIWAKNLREHCNWSCLSVKSIFHLSNNLHISCLSTLKIGLVLLPIGRLRGSHADSPSINYLQKAQPYSHKVKIS